MNRRIAVIAPMAMRADAITAAAVDDFRLLQAEPDLDVTFLTQHNELDLPARVVDGVAGLLDDAAFRRADILIYHFGIYHPLIDALLVGNGHARQIVVFHNITPLDFVSSAERPLIEQSLRQAHNMRRADEIWADSTVNAKALDSFGIDPKRILVVPLTVNRPRLGRLRDKLDEQLEFLCVGRIVASKGVRDLIEAVIRARPAIAAPIRIFIAGNAAFSNPSYIEGCKALIAKASLQDCFEWLIDTPSDETLCILYARAHVLCVPSFHEGFCVPVIEGLRAGCIPVGYASYNVPNVVNRLGRLVTSGDVAGLADALVDVSRGLIEASRNPGAACLALDCGSITVDEFDQRAHAHAGTFDFARLAPIKIAHIRRLLQGLEESPTTSNLDVWHAPNKGDALVIGRLGCD